MSGLKNAILTGIEISKKEKIAEFCLVTDKTYSTKEEGQARDICESYLPEGFSARVKIIKRVPDKDILKRQIFNYVQKNFPAASAFLDSNGIEVEMLACGAHFYVDIASGEQSLFSSGKILDEVSKYLMSGYCGTFYGNVRVVEKAAPDASILDELPEDREEVGGVEIRRFPICEYGKIDGVDAPLTKAVYMADCQNEDEPYSVCGTVTYIEEIKYVRHNEKTG